MTSVTIRDIDEQLEARLQQRAAKHGRSMEDEARAILRTALARDPNDLTLVDSIRARIEPLGGVELVLDPRAAIREPGDREI